MIIDPILAPSMIIVSLAALTGFFIFLEIKKRYRFRGLRILAIMIVMMSLAGMMLRPKYSTTASISVLLLTPGYSEGQVDSIIATNARLSVMHLSNTKPFRNSVLATDEDLTYKEIVFIVGEGLPSYELDRMRNTAFAYVPAPMPEGLTALQLEESYRVNRTATIRGEYNNRDGEVALTLHGPGGVEDSIKIDKKGQTVFSLSFVPRHAGNFSYGLTIRDGQGTNQEILPVHVSKEERLKILFLQSYPTFETQYLKSYLADKNHSMLLRYQLTRTNFRHELVNYDGKSVNQLSKPVLSEFDLVIADASAVSQLSSAEKSSLESAVKVGLGLLVLSPVNREELSSFFPFKAASVKQDTTSLQLGPRSLVLPASRIRVEKQPAIVSVLANHSGILNGYAFLNAGKIGFQLLQETYRLRLSGDSIAYAEVWSPLLEKVARQKEQRSKIKIVSPFPRYENEPVDILIISSGENINLKDDSVHIPLLEDVNVDNVWHARTWAGKKGWHTLETDDGAVIRYYVHERPSWNALNTANQMSSNTQRGGQGTGDNVNEIKRSEDVPPIIFYLTLMIAAGFVWLSPKL